MSHPAPGLYDVNADQPGGQCTVDLFRRNFRYVELPDYRSPDGKWTVKGSTIKAVLRDLAEYATWKTGENAHPSIAMLAVGAGVSWQTAERALIAAEAYRLIEKVVDRNGRPVPNEWRLLNPAQSSLHMRTPTEMRALADAMQLSQKGVRKTRKKTRTPAAEDVPRETPSGGASTPVAGAVSTPVRGAASTPGPLQVPTQLPLQNRACFPATDRTREAHEQDQPMSPKHAEPPADATPIGAGRPPHRAGTRTPPLRKRRAWIDDGTGPEPARYRTPPPTSPDGDSS